MSRTESRCLHELVRAVLWGGATMSIGVENGEHRGILSAEDLDLLKVSEPSLSILQMPRSSKGEIVLLTRC